MESNLMVESSTREGSVGQDDEPLLAAALAALLVEYGRYTSQQEIPEGSSAQTNWRMMGRWEQLRG